VCSPALANLVSSLARASSVKRAGNCVPLGGPVDPGDSAADPPRLFADPPLPAPPPLVAGV
jgi:hypothetical protein